MTEVENVVPGTNETFSSAWTPIAKDHVQKLVDAKKIDAAQANMIVLAFDVVMKGADYIFDVKYPEARQYANLIEAAAHGFCGGFLSKFKPANALAASSTAPQKSEKMDEDAYAWLQSNCKTSVEK